MKKRNNTHHLLHFHFRLRSETEVQMMPDFVAPLYASPPPPNPTAITAHPPMVPSGTVARFLPLRRLKTQTAWVPHAARLKTPKPGCTLSLPVVMVTSLLITTACFHWDSSGLWNWLILGICSTTSPPLLSNPLRASLLVVWQLNNNCTLWSIGWSIHACLLNCS